MTRGNNRRMPDDLQPVTDQALVNFALAGCKVIDGDGCDVTDLILSHAESINEAYDAWLARYRNLTALPGVDAASSDRREGDRARIRRRPARASAQA